MTNNEKKKGNSREGVTSYLNKNSLKLRRETSEGITYESSVGLNLDTSNTESQITFDVSAKISPTELRGYGKIILPYTARPKIVNLSYDSTQQYQFIIFDTETTCTGKLAEVCQLSVVSENGRHEFSTFILPQSNISYSAYLVNGMTIKNIKGVRTLCPKCNHRGRAS